MNSRWDSEVVDELSRRYGVPEDMVITALDEAMQRGLDTIASGGRFLSVSENGVKDYGRLIEEWLAPGTE